MRHLNQTCKLGRTTSHRRCMFANMLKSLITEGKIKTTVPKAKALRRYADQMITLAKKNTLSARRQAIARLMVRFNKLSSKEAREVKGGNLATCNDDRFVIKKLFDELAPRFTARQGGYTRITKLGYRVGDNAQYCLIEYLGE